MQTTLLKKTELGTQVLKTRDPLLPQRLRAAFILFDGHKTVAQVAALLPAAGPGSLNAEDVQALIQSGLLDSAGVSVPAELAVSVTATAPLGDRAIAPHSSLSPAEQSRRYTSAYYLADELVVKLGLRGLRLLRALEKTTGYNDLVALLPKLREAIAASDMEPLEKLLFEPMGG